jgi:IS5 family transposase
MFHKRPGLNVEDMTSSSSIYERLRKFRAGIEGTIAWLKSTFALRRCLVWGRPSFAAHAQTAVFAANLVLLARFYCT